MVFHELVDVQVFSLLQLVHLHALFEFQFFLHFGEFGLVVFLHVGELVLLLGDGELLASLVVVLCECGLLDVYLFFFDYVLLEVLFLLLHVLHAILVVVVLPEFSFLAVLLDVHVCLLLLVFQKLEFLQEDLDFGVVVQLHVLCFCLLVEYFCVHLLYL